MRVAVVIFALLAVGLVTVSAVAFSVSARPALNQGSSRTVPLVQPLTTGSIGTSQIFAGYAVVAAKTVFAIAGDWNIPKVHGKCPSVKTEIAYVGISIGGYSTNESGFAGTGTECYGGSVHDFVTYTIAPYYYLPSMKVSGGDHIQASLTYVSSTRTLSVTLYDSTTGIGVTNHGVVRLGKHSDALWSVQVGASASVAILPLVDFGNVTFTGCTATVNGTTSHDLGHYSNTAIEMYNKAGTGFKAAVGVIASNNKSFGITWKSTGP